MSDAPYLSLIIPVYNGAPQLPGTFVALRAFAARFAKRCEIVFVDDCSDDGATPRLLAEVAEELPQARVLRNEHNRGKGQSVARGMLTARGDYRIFTDADLAYPLAETEKILAALATSADVAVACRVLPDSRYVMSPSYFHYLYTRHLMSRAFNRLAQLTLVPGILDTQAGLKGFTARSAETIFARATIPGFGFDVECLYLARRYGLRVTQVPVYYRYDDEPTTVRFLRDSMLMVGDLARVRWRAWCGGYAIPTRAFAELDELPWTSDMPKNDAEDTIVVATAGAGPSALT